jgi:hypothetical protein
VLDAAQASDAGHQLLDSFAMRHLVLSRPAQLEPLSSMQLSRDAFVLRCRSTSLWGEKCVLTLTLRRRSLAEQRCALEGQTRGQGVCALCVGVRRAWRACAASQCVLRLACVCVCVCVC